jgi:hypothetical protein
VPVSKLKRAGSASLKRRGLKQNLVRLCLFKMHDGAWGYFNYVQYTTLGEINYFYACDNEVYYDPCYDWYYICV